MSADALAQFATCVFDPDDWVEIRCLRGREVKKSWQPARVLPEQSRGLLALNGEGWNIYAGPNPRTAQGRSGDEAVSVCRCLFADFDGIEADGVSRSEIVSCKIDEAGLPVPTLTINSGHGIHVYWRLVEPVDPERWKGLQVRLNFTLGSDATIKNPERIMRLPGFQNVKAEPVPCEIVEADASRVYVLAGIEGHLQAPPEPEPSPAPQPVGDRPKATTLLARATLYADKWPAAHEGSRNSEAYRHAAQLRAKFDLSDGDAWQLLTAWNASNLPPLPEDELRSAFENAKKHANNGPGSEMTFDREYRPPRPVVTDPLGHMDAYISAVESGRVRTVDWPWSKLSDGTQALSPGTLTILSGGPGAAKSLMIMQAIRFWLDDGEAVSYYGMEGTRIRYLMRCLAQLAGKSELTKQGYVAAHADEVRELRVCYADDLAAFSNCLRVATDLGADTLNQVENWIEAEAKRGQRLIVVDPITLAIKVGKAWEADQAFVKRVLKIGQEHGCNVILVTHPEKGIEDPTLYNLAGGAAYSRFSDNVFTLKFHGQPVTSYVKSAMGDTNWEYNQTVGIVKAKEGSLVGRRLAFNFSKDSLCTFEKGEILGKAKSNGRDV